MSNTTGYSLTETCPTCRDLLGQFLHVYLDQGLDEESLAALACKVSKHLYEAHGDYFGIDQASSQAEERAQFDRTES
jgi:hypothetical protein